MIPFAVQVTVHKFNTFCHAKPFWAKIESDCLTVIKNCLDNYEVCDHIIDSCHIKDIDDKLCDRLVQYSLTAPNPETSMLYLHNCLAIKHQNEIVNIPGCKNAFEECGGKGLCDGIVFECKKEGNLSEEFQQRMSSENYDRKNYMCASEFRLALAYRDEPHIVAFYELKNNDSCPIWSYLSKDCQNRFEECMIDYTEIRQSWVQLESVKKSDIDEVVHNESLSQD